MAIKITGMPNQLTVAQQNNLRKKMIVLQDGRCAICEARFVDVGGHPCLDHDHKTGLVRGVLCLNCNGMEGKILNRANRAKRDKTVKEWLLSLIEYWDWHAKNPSAYIHSTHGKKKTTRRRK